jgi:hypothetical protein
VAANGLFILLFLTVGLAAFAFWIWAIVDVVKVADDSMFRAGYKLIWVLVVVFTHVIGAIIYVAVGRPEPPTRATGPLPVDRGQPPPPPPGALG